MRRRPTEQDRSDALLHEWASGVEAAMGYGYPPMPVTASVQGAKADYSAPERYSQYQDRHERLDRAVRRVGDIDPRWKGVLWIHYVQRASSMGLVADRMGATERTCRRWLKAARAAFLREFQALDAGVSVG